MVLNVIVSGMDKELCYTLCLSELLTSELFTCEMTVWMGVCLRCVGDLWLAWKTLPYLDECSGNLL